jgi:hypothetical protein
MVERSIGNPTTTAKETHMQDPTKSADVLTQLAEKTIATLTAWADANQRVVRELVNLGAATATETARLCAELQSTTIEAVRETQAYWLKRQADAPEIPKDPLLWYQKGLVEATQKAAHFIEGGAQAVTKSAEQLQATAAGSGKEIQATMSGLAARMQEIYATV